MSTNEWDEALAQARAEHEPEWQARDRLRAREIVQAKQAHRRTVEREAEQAKRAERERAQLAKQAAKVWRKRFGRTVAGALQPWTRYWLLHGDRRRCWAFSDPSRLIEAAAVLDQGRFRVEAEGVDGVSLDLTQRRGRELLGLDAGIAGCFLTRSTEVLDAVDPPLEAFTELVREGEEQRIADNRRQYQEAAERRRRQREKALFGVELDAD